MKRLEPKFIALHQDTARLDQTHSHGPPGPQKVKLTIHTPMWIHESGESGIAIEPPQSVEIHGTDELMKLANAITEFCGKNKQMVEEQNRK